MGPSRFLILCVALLWSCASRPAETTSRQADAEEVVLARGESRRLPALDLTVAFESVGDDSRCPKDVTCVWQGDAAVGISLATSTVARASYTLHTHDGFQQEAEHGHVRARLVSLAPERIADAPPDPDSYRVTLLVRRKP